jgi:micrococcal nuclease
MRTAHLLVGFTCVASLVWIVRPDPAPSDVGLPGKDPVATRSVPVGAQEVTVSRHTDGDTLHVVAVDRGAAVATGVDTTVRLLEIDAPESVDPRTPPQCFGGGASRRLAELLPVGSHAWVLPDRELLDPFGRTLLYLWNDDGTFVNMAMVREGMAKAVLYEPNDAYIDLLRQAERRARKAHAGLWRACDHFGAPARR